MDAAKVYLDLMSQPCRTVAIFCRLNALPVEEVAVNIGKGETRSEAFKGVNPVGKLPALVDADGFHLSESASLLRYLCDTRSGLPDHWYPACPHARATVNSICDWHLSNLRVGSMLTVFNRAISISMGFQGNEELVLGYALPHLQAALKTIETVWLKAGPFLGDRSEPSIADLLLSCEVDQLCLLDGADQAPGYQDLLAPYPTVRAWLARVAARCEPHYSQVHALLHMVQGRLVARKEQRRQQAASRL